MTRRNRFPTAMDRRPGFTLIELLVVISIILLLFTLTVAFMPAVYKRDDSVRGAQMVQTRLAMARQQARRDGVVTGVRFRPDPTLAGMPRYCTTMTMIQQPMDITGGGGIFLRAPGLGSNLVVIIGADLSSVGVGDYLTINNGVPHRIIGVDWQNGGLRLASVLRYSIGWTREFRIQRRPVPIQGEVETRLPARIAVDLALCSISDPMTPAMMTLVGQGIDVAFSPNGNIVGDWQSISVVVLFVRDYLDPDIKTGGSPMLVGVQTRTGFIGVFPVDPIGYYSRVLDARSSGL